MNPDDRDEDDLTALERAERRRDGVYERVDLVGQEALADAEPQTWFKAFLALNQKLLALQAEAQYLGCRVQTKGQWRKEDGAKLMEGRGQRPSIPDLAWGGDRKSGVMTAYLS